MKRYIIESRFNCYETEVTTEWIRKGSSATLAGANRMLREIEHIKLKKDLSLGEIVHSDRVTDYRIIKE